jgi:hypothetical protein
VQAPAVAPAPSPSESVHHLLPVIVAAGPTETASATTVVPAVAPAPAPASAPDAAAETTALLQNLADASQGATSREDDDASDPDDDDAVTPLPPSPHHPAFVGPEVLALTRLSSDDQFKLRQEGDIAALATSLARVGQLVPIECRALPSGDVQVLCGFRRLKALRFLHREQVLARVHEGLTDSEALVFVLAHQLEQRGLDESELVALRSRLEGENRLSAQARGLIDAALTSPGSDLEPAGDEPQPEPEAEEEVDLDDLGAELESRLSGISSDLSLITEAWGEMEPELRKNLLDQLRYYAELHTYLARQK